MNPTRISFLQRLGSTLVLWALILTALFAGSVMLFGSSRAAVLSVILFFVAGALVLTRVNVAEGEAQAHVSV
jgi:MFS-type transporter involved in bile tolerance (Atg22 family)